jgi:phosphate transport system substrate-binding protein
MNRKEAVMKKMKIVLLIAVLAAANGLAAETLQIDGSTTVGPIGDAFAEAFKDKAAMTVNKPGSTIGATALIEGRCDIAMMSRFMKESEFKLAIDKGVMPVAHAVAMDGVCPIVHPSNPVSELTTEQIKDIYLGKITNWKDLGGADMAIVVISRDTSSGTYETFHELVMNKEKMADHVEYVNSNPQAHARLKNTQGGIAYVGLGFVDRAVKPLKVNGVTPNRSTIAKGIFPVSRPLFWFTNGYPKLGSVVHAFCTFHLTEEGQEIIEDKGFVPMTDY